jgi:LysM repeat protein
MRDGSGGSNLLNPLLLLLTLAGLAAPAFGEQPFVRVTEQPISEASLLPTGEFSPSFLGMYRKVMLIEREIQRYSQKYAVDPALARAVCMYESGGNASLRSPAGARGYFQVMPATFHSLHVRTNIEAGVKYLGQLLRRFTREDYVLAAYNGGPTRVARGRYMPLETRQYVMGVRSYRTVLEEYEPSVRENAEQLHVTTVRPGDDWWQISERLDMPLVQLRLYNPFLAGRNLRPGNVVVYPDEPRPSLLTVSDDNTLYYRTRLGDNLINLAIALGADVDALRQANNLQPLQLLSTGTLLEIPLDASAQFTTYRVTARDDLPAIAERLRVDPWSIVRDNLLWNQRVQPGMMLRIPELPPRPKYLVHRVRGGDNLSTLARRYHTTIRAIQRANSMGQSTRIRIGQRIRIRTR